MRRTEANVRWVRRRWSIRGLGLRGLEWLPLLGMADPSSRRPPTIWRDLPVSASRGRAASTFVPVTRIEVHRGGAPPRLALIGLLGLIGLFEVLLQPGGNRFVTSDRGVIPVWLVAP